MILCYAHEVQNMGIVGDIASLIGQVYKIWQDSTSDHAVSPRLLYDKYVAPSYLLLKEVHTDYLELYLELEERLAMEEELSSETVNWFARSRTRRQADRSELREFEVPAARATRERAKSVNQAAELYVQNVRAYFTPFELHTNFAHARIGCLGPSAATYTEHRLRVMSAWLDRSPADKRALATEEYLEQREGLPEDEAIETILAATAGAVDERVINYLEELDQEARAALESFHDASRAMQRRIAQGEYSYHHLFNWRHVLQEHAGGQRYHFEDTMKAVQIAYIRIRVLADR